MTGSRISAITTSHSIIVPTVRSVVVVSPVSFMLGNRGCRGRIAGRIGLNMLERVELENSDKESIPCAGYKEENRCIYFGAEVKESLNWSWAGWVLSIYLLMLLLHTRVISILDQISREVFSC